jgi:hypothetical protein
MYSSLYKRFRHKMEKISIDQPQYSAQAAFIALMGSKTIVVHLPPWLAWLKWAGSLVLTERSLAER